MGKHMGGGCFNFISIKTIHQKSYGGVGWKANKACKKYRLPLTNRRNKYLHYKKYIYIQPYGITVETRLRISFLLTYRLTVKLFTLFVESGLGRMLSAFWSRAWAFRPGWPYQDRPRVSNWNDQFTNKPNKTQRYVQRPTRQRQEQAQKNRKLSLIIPRGASRMSRGVSGSSKNSRT